LPDTAATLIILLVPGSFFGFVSGTRKKKMQVRIADHLGMCFGVRDAIDLALELTHEGPLTILGDLVHNPDVVAEMDAAGAVRARELPQVKTERVLVTAHGVSDRLRLQLADQGLKVHDATCPLVRRAHLAVLKMVKDGRFPVLIGKAEHVEVRGLVGDLDEYLIIQGESDLDEVAALLRERPHLRLGVASQTTQPVEVVETLVKQMRVRFPDVDIRYYDTVCQPTKDRQVALRKLVTESDVVVVVGGPDSNNSRKLTELARQLGRPAYQVARTAELRPEWFAEYEVVGLTAGTSTPEPVIAEIRGWLEALPVRQEQQV